MRLVHMTNNIAGHSKRVHLLLNLPFGNRVVRLYFISLGQQKRLKEMESSGGGDTECH